MYAQKLLVQLLSRWANMISRMNSLGYTKRPNYPNMLAYIVGYMSRVAWPNVANVRGGSAMDGAICQVVILSLTWSEPNIKR